MRRFTLLFAVSAALASCGSPPPPVAPAGHYKLPSTWLCLPGRDDTCARDIRATEIHADGTRTVELPAVAAAPKADCFYVYPTVDLSLAPANHEDFSDLRPIADTTLAQAARFRESCALYVPLYRQVTIGTYLHPGERLEEGLSLAYSDVEAAFAEYLATYDRGRPIVLLGHSQGAEMIMRLLRRFFDADAKMRARLLVAMPIGADIEVPAGKTVGATFANIPVCTKQDETGCVVAYRSHAAGSDVSPGRSAPHPGDATVCVNPADVEGNALRPLSRAYFPVNDRTRGHMIGVDDVQTPFVMLRDYYTAQCADGPAGYRYLAIGTAAGDARVSPVDFERMPLKKQLGLHIVDYQLPQGDLLALVARRVAKLP